MSLFLFLGGIFTDYFIIGDCFSIIIITNNLKLKAMKKLSSILFFIIAFSCNISAQDSAKFESLAPNNIFETYVVGENDAPSIGLLQEIFFDSSSKEKYAQINPKIKNLKVTGTAAPFEKRIQFSEWIEKYVILGEFNQNTDNVKYSKSERSDGMIQEFLVMSNNEGKRRTVIISRMNGTIISIWDSKLN